MAVQYRKADETLDITIDYREVKKDSTVLWLMHIWAVFWIGGLTWMGLTLVLRDGSWFGGLALVIAALSLYPYCGTLLSRSWAESIRITADTITFSLLGVMTPKPIVLQLSDVPYIALGCIKQWHNQGDDVGETMITLSVFKHKTRAFMIGYWLTYDDKRHVFDAIQAFMQGIPWPGQAVLHDANFSVTWDQQGHLTGATVPAQET